MRGRVSIERSEKAVNISYFHLDGYQQLGL